MEKWVRSRGHSPFCILISPFRSAYAAPPLAIGLGRLFGLVFPQERIKQRGGPAWTALRPLQPALIARGPPGAERVEAAEILLNDRATIDRRESAAATPFPPVGGLEEAAGAAALPAVRLKRPG